MRIFVDATGGDLAPQAPVEGTVEALRRNPELTVTLAGIVPEIEKYLACLLYTSPSPRDS